MLTAEQLEARKGKVMASDIAAYLGFNPHASAFNAWALNLGMDTFEGNAATEAGNFLEEGLLRLAAHRLGRGMHHQPGTIFHIDNPWAGCTPDATYPEGDGIQIKVHGLHQARHFKGQPGDSGEWDNNLIPEWHLCQVTWEMWISASKSWWLGCHFGGGDFRLYHIRRDEDLLMLMINRSHEFWQNHLDTNGPQDPPPIDGSDAAGDYLRRAFPRSNRNMLSEVPQDAEKWAMRYSQSHAKGKEWESAKKEAQNHLIQMVGEADGIEGICTFKETSPKAKTDWEALARERMGTIPEALQIDLINEYTTTPEPSRRFNLKYKPE